jgi:uncharacterized protein YydD (DUF2326 family)
MATKDLKAKIQARLDQLEMLMYENYHLKNPDEVYNQTLHISKFWSILSEEDKDFVQAAQDSIKEGWEWIR